MWLLHSIAPLFASAIPEMGQWLHAHRAALRPIAGAVFALLYRATASGTDALEHALGEAVRESLHLARLTEKSAAALMGTDESNLRKALRGEAGHHISLTRLVRLPFTFWLFFSPTLTYLVARQNVRDVAEDLGVFRRG